MHAKSNKSFFMLPKVFVAAKLLRLSEITNFLMNLFLVLIGSFWFFSVLLPVLTPKSTFGSVLHK